MVFEGYIGLFIFHIISINYATYIDQNLIFKLNQIQNIIIHFFLYIYTKIFTS